MARSTPKAKPTKEPASEWAQVLAHNIRLLMGVNKDLDSNPKLGKKTGLGPSGISRLVNGHNATLASIEAVAAAFELQPWQIMVRGFDPASPPTLQPLSERERQLYLKWKALAKEAIDGEA